MNPLRGRWTLDPSVAFLNHGSFGACPAGVLAIQAEIRARIEREPVQFMVHQLEPLLDETRAALGAFLGANPDDLALVTNASTGVSTVLRSLRFEPGDELLTTDHAYNACKNALDAAAALSGARVVVAKIPFPSAGPDEVHAAVMNAVTPRTKLALIDHVTSPTAVIFPVERLVPALAAAGVDTIVDGAHAPGMLPLDLDALGAAYYTGNCHKWLCAPKGAAFLHVRRDRQDRIRPLTTSHGANVPRSDRSRFRLEFDWTGTADPSAFLCIGDSIRFMDGLLPGGWPAIYARNHAAAIDARRRLCEGLSIAPPCPESMLGSMAAIPLPDGPASSPWSRTDPLCRSLFENHRIEVPIFPWPAPPKRLLRISMPVYADPEEVEPLIRALKSAEI